jgi:RNA polymerase sigma-70 factor (ECF subfamily)
LDPERPGRTEDRALLALLALLDPEVVLRADAAAVDAGASKEVRGATSVAGTFSGRARVAQLAIVNGAFGAAWAPGGKPRVVLSFTITLGKIVKIDLFADPEHLHRLARRSSAIDRPT